MSTLEHDIHELSKMSRSDIEQTYQHKISGREGKDGITFIAQGRSGREYAIKMFKPSKSSAKISEEADLQRKAAVVGVAPAVYAVNPTQKYIVMEKMKETIVAYKQRLHGDARWELPRGLQAQLYALCVRLDRGNVLHNDGNPLNLMLSDSGRLFIIDYGLSKKIDAKVRQTRGPQPNVNLALWHFTRQLKHHGILAPTLRRVNTEYLDALKTGGDYTDEVFLAEGEASLAASGRATDPSGAIRRVGRKRKPAATVHQFVVPTVTAVPVAAGVSAALPTASAVPTTPAAAPARRRQSTSRRSKSRTRSRKKHRRSSTPPRLAKRKPGAKVKFFHPRFKKVYTGTFVEFVRGDAFPVKISFTSKNGNTRTLRLESDALNPSKSYVKRKQTES